MKYILVMFIKILYIYIFFFYSFGNNVELPHVYN